MATSNFTDWFLPSKGDLIEIYTNLTLGLSGIHWSSSEINKTQAWGVSLSTGVSITVDKNSEYVCLPCRRFTADVSEYIVGDEGPGGGYVYYVDSTTYYETGSTVTAATAWSNLTDIEYGAGCQYTGVGDGLINTAYILAYATYLVTALNNGDETSNITLYEIDNSAGTLTLADTLVIPRLLTETDNVLRYKTGESENTIRIVGNNNNFYLLYSLTYQIKELLLWIDKEQTFLAIADLEAGTLTVEDTKMLYVYEDSYIYPRNSNDIGYYKYYNMLLVQFIENDPNAYSVYLPYEIDGNYYLDLKDSINTDDTTGEGAITFTSGWTTKRNSNFVIYSIKDARGLFETAKYYIVTRTIGT